MSHSWRERFEIAICPDEIAVRWVSPGWHSTTNTIVYDISSADIETALSYVVDELRPTRRLPAVAAIVLSEGLTRHALLPWAPQIRSAEERTALMQACFADLYGDQVRSCHIVADRGEYGAATPAGAVDRLLIERVVATLTHRRITPRTITTLFAAVFNHCRTRLSDKPTLLAVGDSGWMTLATFVDRKWNSLRSVRVADTHDELAILLAREPLLHGLPGDTRILLSTLRGGSPLAPRKNVEMICPWGTLESTHRSIALLARSWI